MPRLRRFLLPAIALSVGLLTVSEVEARGGFRARVVRVARGVLKPVKGAFKPIKVLAGRPRPSQRNQLTRQARKQAKAGNFSAALSTLKALEQQQPRRGLRGLADKVRRARAYNHVSKKLVKASKKAIRQGTPVLGGVWGALKKLDRTRGRKGLFNRLLRWREGQRLAGVERALITAGAKLSKSHQHALAHKYFQVSHKVRRHRGKRFKRLRFRVARRRAKGRLDRSLESPRSLAEAQLNIKLVKAYAKEAGRKVGRRQRAKMERGYVNGMMIDVSAALGGRISGQEAGQQAGLMINQARADGMLTPGTVKGILESLKGWTGRGQRIELSGEAAATFQRVARRSPRKLNRLVSGHRVFGNGFVSLATDHGATRQAPARRASARGTTPNVPIVDRDVLFGPAN